MTLSSTSIQSNITAETPQNGNHAEATSLLAALIITMYAANKSRRHLKFLKRKAMWGLIKYKFNSLCFKGN
jgi:hypothetical protein